MKVTDPIKWECIEPGHYVKRVGLTTSVHITRVSASSRVYKSWRADLHYDHGHVVPITTHGGGIPMYFVYLADAKTAAMTIVNKWREQGDVK